MADIDTPCSYCRLAMRRKGLAHIDSDLARALDLLGERWTLLIVQTIRDGKVRFEAIRDELKARPKV